MKRTHFTKQDALGKIGTLRNHLAAGRIKP